MSLIQKVAILVRDERRLSTDDLCARLPGSSRQQIQRAAQNASRLGHIRLAGIARRQGRGQGSGIWEPVSVPANRGRPRATPANSVWDLGRLAAGRA